MNFAGKLTPLLTAGMHCDVDNTLLYIAGKVTPLLTIEIYSPANDSLLGDEAQFSCVVNNNEGKISIV